MVYKEYLKGIVATVLAFLGSLQVAFSDGHVTGGEWIQIAIATVVTGGAVVGVPNVYPTGGAPGSAVGAAGPIGGSEGPLPPTPQ